MSRDTDEYKVRVVRDKDDPSDRPEFHVRAFGDLVAIELYRRGVFCFEALVDPEAARYLSANLALEAHRADRVRLDILCGGKGGKS